MKRVEGRSPGAALLEKMSNGEVRRLDPRLTDYEEAVLLVNGHYPVMTPGTLTEGGRHAVYGVVGMAPVFRRAWLLAIPVQNF